MSDQPQSVSGGSLTDKDFIDYLQSSSLPTSKRALNIIQQLQLRAEQAELKLNLWEATFQKYQSWKANGINGKVIDQVLIDYDKLSKL